MIGCEPDTKLDKSQIFEAFDELNKKIKDMFDVDGPVLLCCKPISELFVEWHERTFSDIHLKNDPCFQYYISKDQRNLLLEDSKDGIPLPEEYYWDNADLEKDTKVLFETWKHSCPGDLEAMQ